ncbi:MAG: CPBP family intramembrane metalloprotease, partial [Candidatus Heimdallarchaeota archaeon]|nr:CPBP family intramembrane metalloprotease [Candidatus Heimdallarchaeota archaeon]
GEELGSRGFALPRLQQKYNPVVASVILGFVHGFWHFPAYWLGGGTHNVPIIWFYFWLFPFTIVLTWIVNRANGSVAAAALVNGWFGVTLSAILFLPSEDDMPLNTDLLTSVGNFSLLSAYIWMAVLFWIFA